MRDFLNEYIVSLTKKRREKIHDLLASAQVGKTDLDEIAGKLVDLRISSPITIGLESVNGIVSSSKFDSTYQDALQRLRELFSASNMVSLLLDTHTSMLASEIKAVEDEIMAIEKAINNYAFSLEENGFYDYVFSETFSDQSMDDTENITYFPDRDGTSFNAEQICYTNTKSGILTLDPDLTTNYSLKGEVIEDNCLSYTQSTTLLKEAFNEKSGTGWKVKISSPRPISTSLSGETEKGAQVKIRVLLPAPRPCDTLIITPLADSPVFLLSVDILSDQDFENDPIPIFNGDPKKLEQPHVLTFPLQPVAAFEFTINQPIYVRDNLPADNNEVLHKHVFDKVKDIRQHYDDRNQISFKYNKDVLQKIFVHTLENRNYKNSYVYKTKFPKTDFTLSAGPMSFDNVKKKDLGDTKRYQNQINDVIRRMIHERLFASNREVLNDRYVSNISTAFLKNASVLNANLVSVSNQGYPRVNVDTPIDYKSISTSLLTDNEQLNYKYNFGIRNVEIGTGLRNFKGVYISKQLPSLNSVDEIKLKADSIAYELIGSSRDSGRLTSIEYSITNRSNPTKESDWVSIMPMDDDEIIGERIFFNEAGVFYPRFYASVLDNFQIYKNGYRVPTDLLDFNMTDDQLGIKSVRVPLNQIFLSDIFTIDYVPYRDAKFVDFKDHGFAERNLASASDRFGGGETYTTTGDSNIITLGHSPYVNYAAVDIAGSTYSDVLGYTSTYQPITVELSDGSIAYNFTNYNGITQTDLTKVSSDIVGYIHSGDKLIFSKELNERFTVYYQYLPSDLRFRVVMRSNSIDYVSPILTTVQVKAKTLKPDARKTF